MSEFIEKALGPEDLYTTAITLVSAEKIDEAIFEFENLLQWYPDYAIAHNDLGVLTYKCGHKDKALRHCEKAIQLQPQNVSFLMNLADLLYVEFDRIQDAILLYYRILSIAPENVETLMVMGQIHIDLGLIKEAKGIYEKVLALEPNNSVSLQLYQFLESFSTIESIDNAPKWLASYRNEGGFF